MASSEVANNDTKCNCEELQPGDLPDTGDYLDCLGVGYIVALSICGLLTLLTDISYLESVIFLMRNLGNWKPRDKAIWLLGLYPVISTTSFTALMVPRAATVSDMVASMYLSLCVYLFVVMLMGHFGGQNKMSKRLRLSDSTKIKLQTPPLCCCCNFLPTLDISVFRLRILEIMVLQFALLKPILTYFAAVLWANNNHMADGLEGNPFYNIVNISDIISTLMAGWGFSMVYRVSQIPLQKVAIKPKFVVLQMVMMITTFQPIIIFFFSETVEIIPCDGKLTATANGVRWINILYIIEMFAISWFARHYYRRHVGRFSPEELVTPETKDNQTGITGTLQRMADENNVVSTAVVGTNLPGSHKQYPQNTLKRNSAPSITTSIGTDPMEVGENRVQVDLHMEPNSTHNTSHTSRNSEEKPLDTSVLLESDRINNSAGVHYNNADSSETRVISDAAVIDVDTITINVENSK